MFKKILFTAAVAVVAVPALASAQSNEVRATAVVAQHALLSGLGNLDFGELSRSADNVINAAGGAGSAVRTLSYNHNVRVSFGNVPENLMDPTGTLSLPVVLTCASRVGAGSWSMAGACTTAQFDLDVGNALTEATLGFGGTILGADAANAVAASYSGTLDILLVAR